MDKHLKQAMIDSASAKDTYKTWYVAKKEIPLSDVLLIENIKTKEVYYKK